MSTFTVNIFGQETRIAAEAMIHGLALSPGQRNLAELLWRQQQSPQYPWHLRDDLYLDFSAQPAVLRVGNSAVGGVAPLSTIGTGLRLPLYLGHYAESNDATATATAEYLWKTMEPLTKLPIRLVGSFRREATRLVFVLQFAVADQILPDVDMQAIGTVINYRRPGNRIFRDAISHALRDLPAHAAVRRVQRDAELAALRKKTEEQLVELTEMLKQLGVPIFGTPRDLGELLATLQEHIMYHPDSPVVPKLSAHFAQLSS